MIARAIKTFDTLMLRHQRSLRYSFYCIYAWVLVSFLSYSMSGAGLEHEGILAGTPLWIQIYTYPSAIAVYFAQLVSFGRLVQCPGVVWQAGIAVNCYVGVVAGSGPLLYWFDRYWLILLGAVFVSSFLAFRSLLRSVQVASVIPAELGLLILLSDGRQFDIEMTQALTPLHMGWFTNEVALLSGALCFTLASIGLAINRFEREERGRAS
jgi:hypothetical protein